MVFTIDNMAVFIAFWIAYLLRFNFVVTDFYPILALYHAIITLGVYVMFSLIFRSYTGLLRHTTIVDVLNVFIATTFSFMVLFFLSLFSRWVKWSNITTLPLSIIMIHYVLISCILFSIRISIKVFYYMISSSLGKKKNVVVFGAGALGIIVERVIYNDVQGDYHIIGFLDKNKNLHGKKLNGICVYSPTALTLQFKHRHDLETLIFATDEISAGEKSEVIRKALELGLEVLETPSVDSWLNGQLRLQQIQKVKIKDLLGRDPIQLNLKRIGINLTGKTIMVSGAAGSIGSEIVRQLARFNIKKLILVDQAETPMFHIENELRKKNHRFIIKPVIADVTNHTKMEHVFQRLRPEIVFHAAAYKHVPLMEDNPHEAIRVNVGGTKLLTELSVKYGVKKFVMISTDKAVNPANIMGTSKRICEMIVQTKAQQAGKKTQFVITRFGNVLGSTGSVIPLFTKQIEEGGPITVTHPEITRYFMTIPEACELVLEAGFMGKGGEIFEFDMGKPVKIVDLAYQMIRLSGMEPGKDIKVVYTGLRPGEKLYEELLSDDEKTIPTHHPKIKIAQVDSSGNQDLLIKIDNLLYNLYDLTKLEVAKFCKEIVPEYVSSNSSYSIVGESRESPDDIIKPDKNFKEPPSKVLNGYIQRNQD
jgi:FlaA1/EpsC-like NDP-sugar epimerase